MNQNTVFPVYLKNGDQVKLNDHVYCSPSWAVRDGTPYSVARIMEFLPPEDTPKGPEGRLYFYSRVRLAWYYRPSDFATLISSVQKCHVVHRDKISDLSGWKKRPDHFYFNRLFDPYIKKEFEIIQSSDVRNLPDKIRETLQDRYEYIVAEKEVVPDLTDVLRLCDTCEVWCPSPDSVQCDRCKRFFHMRCVQPPLAAKPSRGYGWTCAPCSKRHEELVEGRDVRPNVPIIPKKTNAPAARGRGRPRKDRTQAEKEENMAIKHYRMWPFRYFGQYTVAEDTLDPEDLIFPRAGTRLGPKFQATVAAEPEQDPDISGTLSFFRPVLVFTIYSAEQDERGSDNTVEVLSAINILTEAEGKDASRYVTIYLTIFGFQSLRVSLEVCKARLTNDKKLRVSVDWLTEVIHRFSVAALAAKPLSSVSMKNPMRMEKWKRYETRYTDKEWSVEEIAAFEDAIAAHGPELRAVRDEVVGRTIYEVVRFYGHWKCSKLGEENVRILEHGMPAKPPGKQYRSIAEAAGGQSVGLADDEGSIISHPSKTATCGACRTRESRTWWKAPKGLSTSILCDTCGTNWRKYADLNVRPIREESVPATKKSTEKAPEREKREGTPLAGPVTKRARTSTSAQSTPPPVASTAPQLRCMACLKNGPLGKVLKCKRCEFRVHAGACGAIVPPESVDDWICEICQNEETQEASLNSECLLCPRKDRGIVQKAPPARIAPESFLHARKTTEGQNWTHVLCSVFIPELTFTDASRLRSVEGLSSITRHRWTTKCCLCQDSEGAVIRCSDCSKEYHASCAWRHGHKFGFEIQPVKSSRRETTTTTTFKGESGCMNAIVSCKEHDHSKRDIYGICETNEGGETALQVYCQAYKQAPVSQAHGLLRKARRVDPLLRSNIRLDSNADLNAPEPECFRCHTRFSPAFYPRRAPRRRRFHLPRLSFPRKRG
ncbi:Lid2 complex component snt2 [Mycena sanguinolenta]|uniref:Lid2 complex component snt2 n=1 Tax=Mycena sanguinolenta TaxID=230812 RepID=A0A8H6Z413_9AGAR|nr:Lid2 complex component snt2 [Mycena sanguinolenta]